MVSLLRILVKQRNSLTLIFVTLNFRKLLVNWIVNPILIIIFVRFNFLISSKLIHLSPFLKPAFTKSSNNWLFLINLRELAMAQFQLKWSSIVLVFLPLYQTIQLFKSTIQNQTDQTIQSLYFSSGVHEWLEACHYQPSL